MSSDSTIFITRNDVPSCAVDLLKQHFNVKVNPNNGIISKDELLKGVKDVTGIFCMLSDKINEEVITSAGPSLKVVATYSVGYDHISLPVMKSNGIKVGYTPDVLTESVAELTVGLLLSTARNFFSAHKEIFNGGWQKNICSPVWMVGGEISFSTVGIFGLGRIGLAIMKRLTGFNVKEFLYTSRSEKPDAAKYGARKVDLDELVTSSDYIIIACALNSETKEIFNKDVFSKMKPTSYLVNISRGGVINQNDLINALTSNQIAGAGLDVMTPEPLSPDHPLTKLPNCTLLPHIGSASFATRDSMAMLTAKNIIAAIKGEKMPAELTF